MATFDSNINRAYADLTSHYRAVRSNPNATADDHGIGRALVAAYNSLVGPAAPARLGILLSPTPRNPNATRCQTETIKTRRY